MRHVLVYSSTKLVDFSAQKANLIFFRFRPIVRSMTSLYKLNTRGAGPISFHKLCNFWKSFSWFFATMSDQPPHNLGILGQPTGHPHVGNPQWPTAYPLLPTAYITIVY